jgi:hypothetical protein
VNEEHAESQSFDIRRVFLVHYQVDDEIARPLIAEGHLNPAGAQLVFLVIPDSAPIGIDVAGMIFG